MSDREDIVIEFSNGAKVSYQGTVERMSKEILKLRKQLAEALKNEQSSASAYAEAERRLEQMNKLMFLIQGAENERMFSGSNRVSTAKWVLILNMLEAINES